LVRTIDEVRALVAELKKAGRFGFRVLPDAPSSMRTRVVGIAASTGPRHARYISFGASTDLFGGAPGALRVEEALSELKDVLEDASIAKIGHDLKFDAIVLERHGIRLAGV